MPKSYHKTSTQLTTQNTSEGALVSHFEKHAAEFGYSTAEEYLAGAQNLTSEGTQGVETFIRANGDTLFYNPAANEFGVLTEQGIIRTYFRPVDGIGYWLKMIGK